MSHNATNWAIRQKGLRPAAKIVLWHLCDRYHPDHGCFPSQETLAEDCEMSRSAVNSHLSTLEERNLILREARKKDGRQDRTSYRFPFEEDWPGSRAVAEVSRPDSGHEAESENEGVPSPESEAHRVANPDSYLPVREPVTEPKAERDARAPEGQEAEPHVPDAELLAKLIAAHPQSAHDSVADTQAAWKKLTQPERRDAVDRFADWLGAKGARKAIAGLPVYLGEKRWLMLAPAPGSGSGAPPSSRIGAFSRPWWWLFFDFLARRGAEIGNRNAWAHNEINRQISLALHGIGWKIVPAERERIEAASKALHQVPKDGIEAAHWVRYCAEIGPESEPTFRRGFRMPIPDIAEWIFVPAEFPVAAEDLADVAPTKPLLHDGGRRT